MNAKMKPVEKKIKKQDNISIAEALYNFANKMSKKPHKHWYLGFNRENNVTFYPEEQGLYQQKAVEKTVKTIKKACAMELDSIIKLRSQGIWIDYWVDKDGKKHYEETGCSVVPTREVVKVYEKLSEKKHKAWRNNKND